MQVMIQGRPDDVGVVSCCASNAGVALLAPLHAMVVDGDIMDAAVVHNGPQVVYLAHSLRLRWAPRVDIVSAECSWHALGEVLSAYTALRSSQTTPPSGRTRRKL